jgi:pimeloyl-ACP methyl ester carboxylesterase
MTDPLESFLGANTSERLGMARDARLQRDLRSYLGEAGLAAYLQLAERVDHAHLAIEHPTDLVFVPGICGSLLRSRTKGGVWWLDARSLKHIEDLRLQPDGLTDASPEDVVVPFAIDTTYEPFLTAALARDDFGHDVFPYDWRKPIEASTAALRRLIEATYADNGGESVHLVAHSMGGLVVRQTLRQYDDLWDKIGKVVFIGTPHYGSPAMGGYLKNHFWGFEAMALLGLYLSRETFRTMWGALALMPAPRGIYPGTRSDDADPWPHDIAPYSHPCANFDLHDAGAWQLDLTTRQSDDLQRILIAAARLQRDLDAWHLQLSPMRRARMLVIAGVGYKTLFRLEYLDRALGLWKTMGKLTERQPGHRHRDGDGRVPLASAMLPDVETRFVRGVHGGLQNIPVVYEDVFRWLNDETLRLPADPAGALSQHLAADASVSDAPMLDGTDRAVPFSDDPGYLDARELDPGDLSRLDAALRAGEMPDFQRLKLL